MKLVGYVRVSTQKQVDEGLSLDVQQEQIESYAKFSGAELVSIERDEGISGKTIYTRPGVMHVLDMLRRNQADGVVVVKLDRLSRSVRELLQIVDDHFQDGKKHFISLTEHIDTSSAVGRAMLSLMAVFAQMEREQTGERIKLTMGAKRKRREYTGGVVPYGFERQKHETGDGPDILVPNEDEQRVISYVLDRRAEKSWRDRAGYRAIARELNATGFRTRKGNDFTATDCRRMCLRVAELGTEEEYGENEEN